jgi:hypothetical protein
MLSSITSDHASALIVGPSGVTLRGAGSGCARVDGQQFVVVNFHVHGCAVWLSRASTALRRAMMASRPVTSLGENAFR